MIRISLAFDFNAAPRENGSQTGIFGGVDARRRCGGWQPTVHHAARMGLQSLSEGTQTTPGAASWSPP
jgi:hypothetical protein